MFTLTVSVLALASVFFWTGYQAPYHPLQYRSRGAFLTCLALAGFCGYFAWRESLAIDELAEIIEPIPDITDVTYISTSGEVAGVSRFMAAVPGKGRAGTTQEERQELAERASEIRTEYWIIKTALGAGPAVAFYRDAAVRSGWTIENDDPPWLHLTRGSETLFLFITDDTPRTGARIVYGFRKPESEHKLR